MKIAIIAPNPTFQTDDLIKKALEKGHHADLIRLEPIELSGFTESAQFINLLEYDVILFRNGAEMVSKMALGLQLTERGKKFINSGYYLNPLLANKIYQNYSAHISGLQIPKTLTLKKDDFENIEKYIELIGGFPIIVKPKTGAKGKGVNLVKDLAELKKLSEEISIGKSIFQQYIPNDGDYRVLVVGYKAIGAYKRIPKEGDFRANISQGGHGEVVNDEVLLEKLYTNAEKIAVKLNLEICGIDLIKSKENEELYLIESNSIPQWEGFTETTGIDVASKILSYLENHDK